MEQEINVHRLHDDQVIGARELAKFLNTTEGQIYKLSATDASRLPPRLTMLGRRLAWRMGACRQWLRRGEVQEPTDSSPAQPPKTGRPRKS